MLQRFCVIVGPTAGGKSNLAMQLADALEQAGHAPAEIISADSMQVYRGMDIGTAKPTPQEQTRRRHHLIDLRDPTESFSVDDWLTLAEPIIESLRARNGAPIVVGGTHLYVKTLLEGLFQGPDPDPERRARLAALDPIERRRRLEQVDPAAAARIHPNDHRRTIRALEVHEQTGRPLSDWQKEWDQGNVRPDALLIGLDWPVEAINRRINARVRHMIDIGLVDEARDLWNRNALGPQAREALGYKQLIRHFDGKWTLEQAIEQIKVETRRFAKNQRTWLRRLRTIPGAIWYPAAEASHEQITQDVVGRLVTTN